MYNVYYYIQKILKFQYFTEISVFHRNQEPRFLEKFFLGNLVLGSWKILEFQFFLLKFQYSIGTKNQDFWKGFS